MGVSIITATENPMDVISIAAGCCYGKLDISHRRVRNCISAGHLSVLEHASVCFKVDGVSRSLSHQLVRHRLASYCQKSQRYTLIDFDTDWYVKPPAFDKDDFLGDNVFEVQMDDCAQAYKCAISNGIKPEDARYLLPEATKTEIVCSMNCRELFHFLTLRTDKAAQWEIRDMANDLLNAVAAIDDQWGELMGLWSAS